MDLNYLAHIRAESERFADVLAGADPNAPVPTCPGWTAADLLWHLTEVQLFWAVIVRDRLADPSAAENKPPRPDDYGELHRLFTSCLAQLDDALTNTPEDVAVWTWFDSDQSAGFVRRRQAHEALIHRLDAELTVGSTTEVDPQLATDGALEFLEVMFSEVPAWAEHALDDAIGRVATTDTGAQWLVRTGRLSGTSPRSGRSYTDHPTLRVVDAGEPTYEVSGAARDLDAWLWNRPAVEPVSVTGNSQRFEQIVHEGVQ